MRIAGIIVSACIMLVAAGAEESAAGPFDFLPEVVATVDSVPIRRDELAAQLTLSRQAPPNADRAVLARLMRQAVEERIYLDIIRQLLAEQRIVPDEASALAYLKEMNALLPRGIPGVPPAEFARLAAEPQFQLNAALHRYFKQCYPDWVKVDDREVENAYRLDQQRFLLPEKLELGVIEVERSRDNARETIEDARARLRQGENFDRVAVEVSPDGVKSSAETVMELFRISGAKIPVRGVSEVLESGDRFLLLMVRERIPARFVPLKDAAPYLREQLAAAKVGRALELLLRRELARRDIRYFPDVPSGGNSVQRK
ncbi:peptidyl-prolyl cis-trans isomerase [Victivallis vadensis]|uniref:peptidylprolyl isomerase n=1 Tax=Victivallis vadensis TaxID=172901 RepID=A0A848AZM3_9BACT|nr:peptidylprolyl isomerase [Victivallis vadensis]NMD87853.1 peptidyl-prolyl cis-trans isomerase [Victivallis vadensis]